MAEEKKKEDPGWNLDLTESILVFLFFLGFASTIIPAIFSYVSSGQITFYGFRIGAIVTSLKNHAVFLKTISYAIAGVAAMAAFAFTKMADSILALEKTKLFPSEMERSEAAPLKNPMVERWAKILTLSESSNQSDWRLAIIEADIILDDLLESLRLPGNTMGDKLKAIEPSDFLTLDAAWEAHKTRNMIAHQGSNFLLNQREVRRVISLYESVFREFELI